MRTSTPDVATSPRRRRPTAFWQSATFSGGPRAPHIRIAFPAPIRLARG